MKKTRSKFVKLRFDKDLSSHSCDGFGGGTRDGSYGSGIKGRYGNGAGIGSGDLYGTTSGCSYNNNIYPCRIQGRSAGYGDGAGDCHGEVDNTGGNYEED